MNGEITESELEFFHGEEREDAFDVAAKQLFMVIGRLRQVFRGKNLRASGTLTLKKPVCDVDTIKWCGIRGDFMIRRVGQDLWIPISEASSDRPWLMIPLASNSKKLFKVALDLKEKTAKSMLKSSDDATLQMQKILENK